MFNKMSFDATLSGTTAHVIAETRHNYKNSYGEDVSVIHQFSFEIENFPTTEKTFYDYESNTCIIKNLKYTTTSKSTRSESYFSFHVTDLPGKGSFQRTSNGFSFHASFVGKESTGMKFLDFTSQSSGYDSQAHYQKTGSLIHDEDNTVFVEIEMDL
jgi:hypothetical protein